MNPEREKEIREFVKKMPSQDAGIFLGLLAEIDRFRKVNDKLSTDLVNREAVIGEIQIANPLQISELREKLAIAVEALGRLETVCDIEHGSHMKHGVKKLVKEALAKIRGEK